MIRGNWSLAAEVRNNERKQQNKVQQRQKHQHKLKKLATIDPIRLYYQIQKLEKEEELPDRDAKYLKGLKEDWEFIDKNKLHQEKLKPFLEKLEREATQREAARNKLWGKQSIYFNPELNPLGKVPANLPNLTKPLKGRNYHKHDIDPTISSLGVVMPEGDPPKFYKIILNTERNATKIESEAQPSLLMTPRALQKRKKPDPDHESQAEDQSEHQGEYNQLSTLAPEEEEYLHKRPKKP